ncbi:hypothetical protein OBBRIDRAFT_558080 [Obba rivulosa]|uniref:Uncharacterized protein n=1 Tax=Obba rivulosa TaxID=1052685 RepID=A0A8E2DKX6_9APHY|nr:hypothetical protein OBBRIDRAFT_558080 [Obba rivulosa]
MRSHAWRPRPPPSRSGRSGGGRRPSWLLHRTFTVTAQLQRISQRTPPVSCSTNASCHPLFMFQLMRVRTVRLSVVRSCKRAQNISSRDAPVSDSSALEWRIHYLLVCLLARAAAVHPPAFGLVWLADLGRLTLPW